MIVVTVMGGLGNQMFQYAFGRAASLALERELVLDLTLMPTGHGQHIRRWELPNLPIKEVRRIGEGGLLHGLKSDRPVLRKIGASMRKVLGPWRVSEPPEGQLFALSELPRPVALCVGYWQSHRYFEQISDLIRRELTPAVTCSDRVSRTMRGAAGRQVISVHVRRGDYVSDHRTAEFHGNLSASYYRGAVRELAVTLADPVAFVFSDDAEWAVQNLNLDIETFHLEAEGSLPSVEAMALMARCDHHVIANSSFSWWGAYLATSPNQHVIYPPHWFVDQAIDPQIRFPAHWRPSDAW